MESIKKASHHQVKYCGVYALAEIGDARFGESLSADNRKRVLTLLDMLSKNENNKPVMCRLLKLATTMVSGKKLSGVQQAQLLAIRSQLSL